MRSDCWPVSKYCRVVSGLWAICLTPLVYSNGYVWATLDLIGQSLNRVVVPVAIDPLLV